MGPATVFAYRDALFPEGVLIAGWLAAQALWLAAFIPAPHRLVRPSRRTLWEAAGVAVVLLLAAWLRLWNNGALP